MKLLIALILSATELASYKVVAHARAREWKKLSQAIAAGQLHAATTPSEVNDYSEAQRIACAQKQPEIADKLAALGGKGALFCLGAQGKWDAVHAELAKVGAVSQQDGEAMGYVDLMTNAVSDKQDAIALELVAHAAPDFDAPCSRGFDRALSEGNTAVAKSLVEKCPKVKAELPRELDSACARGEVKNIQQLTQLGADPKAELPGGSSCLADAARAGSLEAVNHLLGLGVDPKATAKNGDAPLAMAIQSANPEVVKALLAHGADGKSQAARAAKFFLLPASLDAAHGPWPYLESDGAATTARHARVEQIAALLNGEQKAVIIIAGGTTDAEAQQGLESWKAVEPLAAAFFKVSPGFPKMVKSADVPGLKPGFTVVLLAAAREFELAPFLPVVQAIRPGSYLREVTWSPESGGAPLTPAAPKIDDLEVHTRKLKGGKLLSLAAAWTGSENTSIATLVDAKFNLLDSAKDQMHFGHDCSGGGRPDFEEHGSGYEASGTCEMPGCTEPNTDEMRQRLSVKDDKLDFTQKDVLVHKGQCD